MPSSLGLFGPLLCAYIGLLGAHPSNGARSRTTNPTTGGTNQRNRWVAAGIGGGGSFYEPSLSPLAKGEIFVTSDMSGLYHSRDDGEQFTMTYSATIDGGPGCRVQYTPVKDWLCLLRSMICVSVPAHRGSHLTKKFIDPRRYTVDKKYPGGLPTCSVDGGASWTPVSPDPTAATARRLFTDELRGNLLLVADKTALYASPMPTTPSCGPSSLKLQMAYNSTKGELFASGAFFQPNNAASDQLVLVGIAEGVLYSSNGGADFQLLPSSGIPDADGILSFSAGVLADGSIALHAVTAHLADITDEVLMERNEGLKLARGVFRATLRTDFATVDAPKRTVAWKSAMDGLPPLLSMGGKAGSVGANAVDCSATDGETVYLSSNNGTNGAPLIYKSEKGEPWRSVFGSTGNTNVAIGYEGDGGYAPLTGGFGWSWGGGAEGFTVCANDPNRLAFSDTGFFHGSNDGGASWHALYVKPDERNPPGQPVPPGKAYSTNGLEDTSSWYLHWFDKHNLFAGYTDIRGLRSVTGGRTWSYNYSGHDLNTMYHAETSPITGVTYAATSGTHDMYQDTHVTPAVCDKGEGRVISTMDQGATWQVVHEFGHPVTMVATSPTHPHTVYAGALTLAIKTLSSISFSSRCSNRPCSQ